MFIKQLINSKIKQLTSKDLMEHSEEYGFSLTEKEAEEIILFYQKNDIDPFDSKQRMRFFKQLSIITNEETAKKAHRLFIELIRQYNLEHLFK